MAPHKDDQRAGEKTRLHLAQLNLLEERREKAIERARKYQERKRTLLQNTMQRIVGSTTSSITSRKRGYI